MTAELKQRIEEREAFLKKILDFFDFFDSFVLKHGVVVERDQSSGTAKVVRKLENFNGFSFTWCLGHHNNHIGISKYAYDAQLMRAYRSRVFSMTYLQGIEDCHVGTFSSDGNWQKELLETMSNAEAILAKQVADEQWAQADAEEAKRRYSELAPLQERARKLGLL
jgi:hypothetical protein